MNSSAAMAPLPAKPEVHFDADEEKKTVSKINKGKGSAPDVGSGGSTPRRMLSPPAMDPLN